LNCLLHFYSSLLISSISFLFSIVFIGSWFLSFREI